jgi:outer membrane protein assembly factor BamB
VNVSGLAADDDRQAPRRHPRVKQLLLGMLCLAGFLALFLLYNAAEPRRQTEPVTIAWAFTPAWPGAIISSPLVAGDRLYVSAIRDAGLSSGGLVLCFERHTGSIVWQFDDCGNMQHTYSSPCLDNGRVYVGEGMHANPTCKLYCVDAASGRKLWDFTAQGHVESTPCVADGRVYFGAGDDGLYCCDATTGAERWHYAAHIHVDSNPVVVDGKLYAGSGVSRTYATTEVFCLDAMNGKLLWRLPTDLPAWGSPLVNDGQVFIGLGNGRLDQSVAPPEKPAGALLCLQAGSHELWWRYDVRDAVLAKPVVTAQRVFFVARDGNCYAADRQRGGLEWKTTVGSPMVANPALAGNNLYVAGTNGRVCCLDSENGEMQWSFDVARVTRASVKLFSSPAVVSEEEPGSRSVYVGAELSSAVASAPALYCLRDHRSKQ